MSTVVPNPAKPPCLRCGGVWFAKGLCRKHYWQDYNERHPERQTAYNHFHRKGRRHQDPAPALAVERPRCKHSWCKKPLEFRVTLDGRVIAYPCEPCSRFKRGLCYTCGKALGPDDVWYSKKNMKWYRRRWHVKLGCWEKHRQRVTRRAGRAFVDRHREEINAAQGKRQRLLYANKIRKEDLPFLAKQRRVRRKAANPNQRVLKSRGTKYKPCPERGCKNLISYTFRPPDRCDSCWEKRALLLMGGDARNRTGGVNGDII